MPYGARYASEPRRWVGNTFQLASWSADENEDCILVAIVTNEMGTAERVIQTPQPRAVLWSRCTRSSSVMEGAGGGATEDAPCHCQLVAGCTGHDELGNPFSLIIVSTVSRFGGTFEPMSPSVATGNDPKFHRKCEANIPRTSMEVC